LRRQNRKERAGRERFDAQPVEQPIDVAGAEAGEAALAYSAALTTPDSQWWARTTKNC
jgi:hypothetical protein